MDAEKKSLHADGRDRSDVKEGRRKFRRKAKRLDAKRLVCMDETGVDTSMPPTHGWAPKGRRVEVRTLLEQGLECGSKKTTATCREILKIEPSLWTFATTEGVEPTNNDADRALRHAVCWRKTSFGIDSATCSRFVEWMLTTVEPRRRQKRDLLAFLVEAVEAYRSGGELPSLLAADA